MKNLKRIIMPMLVLAMLGASLATAQANDRGSSVGSLDAFQSGGIINRVNSTELVANGKQFRFNTPVQFAGGSLKKSLGALQTGDHVWLKGKVLNGVFYIDTISVLPSSDDS